MSTKADAMVVEVLHGGNERDRADRSVCGGYGGGTVQYYSGGWHDIGPIVNGTVTIELLPLSYSFSMNYAFARQEKAQNVGGNPLVTFQTGRVHSGSGNCVQYYAGGWQTFTQDMELLPQAYSFKFTDGLQKNFPITGGVENLID